VPTVTRITSPASSRTGPGIKRNEFQVVRRGTRRGDAVGAAGI